MTFTACCSPRLTVRTLLLQPHSYWFPGQWRNLHDSPCSTSTALPQPLPSVTCDGFSYALPCPTRMTFIACCSPRLTVRTLLLQPHSYWFPGQWRNLHDSPCSTSTALPQPLPSVTCDGFSYALPCPTRMTFIACCSPRLTVRTLLLQPHSYWFPGQWRNLHDSPCSTSTALPQPLPSVTCDGFSYALPCPTRMTFIAFCSPRLTVRTLLLQPHSYWFPGQWRNLHDSPCSTSTALPQPLPSVTCDGFSYALPCPTRMTFIACCSPRLTVRTLLLQPHSYWFPGQWRNLHDSPCSTSTALPQPLPSVTCDGFSYALPCPTRMTFIACCSPRMTVRTLLLQPHSYWFPGQWRNLHDPPCSTSTARSSPAFAISHVPWIFLRPAVSHTDDVHRLLFPAADRPYTSPPATQLLVSWPMEKPARLALQYVDCASPAFAISHVRWIFLRPAVSHTDDVHRLLFPAADRPYTSPPATQLLVSWPMEKPARLALQYVDCASPAFAISHVRWIFLRPAVSHTDDVHRLLFPAADRPYTSPPATQLLVSWPMEKPARLALQYVDCASPAFAISHVRWIFLRPAVSHTDDVHRLLFPAADRPYTSPPATQLLVSWPMEKPARLALQYVDCASPAFAISHVRWIFLRPAVSHTDDVHRLLFPAADRPYTSPPATQLLVSWPMEKPARLALQYVDCASPAFAISHVRWIFLRPAVSHTDDVHRLLFPADDRPYTSPPATQLLVSWPMEKPARPTLQYVDCASPAFAISHVPWIFLRPAVSHTDDVHRLLFPAADRLYTSPPATQLLVSWPMEKPARPTLQYVDCA
ncbi:uncharacterized protein [Dermacentor albipictus]|uniref:uncharacterized protein n=1 Tax=Dermacentor albipictus TaxID=60249 RepID=UPI0038FC0D51